MAVDPKKLVEQCNEKTIAVVAILGNHYNGVYDPVWDIDKEVQNVNEENDWQIGIHVDGASGGFVAPFQTPSPPPFDFRLPNVMSISSSGHKFGESICGTGWVVFRERKNLAEHIAVSVTYLGGQCDSMTLNFSRPASGPYVQYYKLLRLGKNGYSSKIANQMGNAAFIRNFLMDLKHPSGKHRFEMLDGGDSCCLPVVAARLNPEIQMPYDDIDLQHALSAT
jgi:glutamate decarboxylase